jgi:hypothetical protein
MHQPLMLGLATQPSHLNSVFPAKAGIHSWRDVTRVATDIFRMPWIPAFAGMTGTEFSSIPLRFIAATEK